MLRQSYPALGLYLFLILTFWLYHPGLDGGFLLDDLSNLEQLQDLESGLTTWQDIVTHNESGHLGRPIPMLSFIADQLAGGGLARPFKYTNLMIHLLCGVLVFWLAGRLFRQTRLSQWRWWLALWVAGIWLVTPIQISAVLYIVQRMAQLSTLFVLAGLISYVIGRQALDRRPRAGILLILCSYIIWLPLALFSKENGALLPLLALVIEIFFFRFEAAPAYRRFLLILFSVTVALPALLAIGLVLYEPSLVTAGYVYRDFTLGERLLSESRILFSYLRALLVPDSTVLGLFHDDFRKSTGLLQPLTTLLSLLGWFAVAVLVIKKYKSKWSPALFGIAFFLAGHALESTVFPLELYFEHRNYLPSIGVYLSLAYLFGYYSSLLKKRTAILAFMLALPLVQAVATYQHVLIWRTNKSIYFSALHTHPDSPRVHGEIAIIYANRGDADNALEHFHKAAQLEPRYGIGTSIFSMISRCMARQKIAAADYDMLGKYLSVKDAKFPITALRALLRTTRSRRCPGFDAKLFIQTMDGWLSRQDAAKDAIRIWLSLITLAQLEYDAGMYDKALASLDKASTIIPDKMEPGLLKIRYLLDKNNLQAARIEVKKLKTIKSTRRDHVKMLSQYDAYIRYRLRKRHRQPGKR